MRKILLQWAGVGILSLIGWGVGLMPGVTSWLPSSIMWGIAFLWLIGTIIYVIRHRVNPNDEVNKRALRETLGGFLEECRVLRIKCQKEETSPKHEIDDLANRLEIYLQKNLGDAYIARLNSSAGLLPIVSTPPPRHMSLWSQMNRWMVRLDQFIAELKD